MVTRPEVACALKLEAVPAESGDAQPFPSGRPPVIRRGRTMRLSAVTAPPPLSVSACDITVLKQRSVQHPARQGVVGAVRRGISKSLFILGNRSQPNLRLNSGTVEHPPVWSPVVPDSSLPELGPVLL